MNTKTILLLLAASLALLLCGCGIMKKPVPETPPQPPQPETGGEPLELTAFSFSHSGSMANDCYTMELTREENGTHIYAEELFSGGRIADVVLEEDLLTGLGELMGMYYVDRWDGFDKTNSMVRDGEGFSLSLTLADGRTVYAHGSNCFPKNYTEVFSEIRPLYNDLMEKYGEEGVNAP